MKDLGEPLPLLLCHLSLPQSPSPSTDAEPTSDAGSAVDSFVIRETAALRSRLADCKGEAEQGRDEQQGGRDAEDEAYPQGDPFPILLAVFA